MVHTLSCAPEADARWSSDIAISPLLRDRTVGQSPSSNLLLTQGRAAIDTDWIATVDDPEQLEAS